MLHHSRDEMIYYYQTVLADVVDVDNIKILFVYRLKIDSGVSKMRTKKMMKASIAIRNNLNKTSSGQIFENVENSSLANISSCNTAFFYKIRTLRMFRILFL